MNILLLTHSYPEAENTWRGSFVQAQAGTLSRYNKVVAVHFKVDYRHFAPFARYSYSKNINGLLTEYTLIIKRSFPVINQFTYLVKTYMFIKKEILKSFKPDIIHSHFSYPAGFLGTIIRKR